jgi:hypothetical protein
VAKLNKLRLLAELRRLLRKPDTRVVERKLRHACGESTWRVHETQGIQDITVVLDPRRDGRVRLVIHELLHVYFGEQYDWHDKWTYELEESVILALEKKLYDWLHDPKRADALESWSRAIERKM